MNARYCRLILLALLYYFIIAAVYAHADDNSKQFLMMGMKDNFDRLQRGVFQATGRFTDRSPDFGDLEGEVTLFSAFDFQKDWLRFDRSEPVRKHASPNSKTWVSELQGGRFAHTPEGSVQWHLGTTIAGIKRASEAPSSLIRPFDIRSLGIYFGNGLSKGYPFRELHARYLEYPLERVVSTQNGIHQLTFLLKPYPDQRQGDVRVVLWIDEKAGFSPIRTEWTERDLRDLNAWKPSMEVNETTYQLVSEVWVPRTYRTERRSDKVSQCLELAFEWQSVNQPVPRELFTKEGLELKTGTSYMDTTSGKPIVVGAAGVKNFPNKFGPEGPIYDKPTYAWLYWTLGSLAAAMLLVALPWYRRRAKAARNYGG